MLLNVGRRGIFNSIDYEASLGTSKDYSMYGTPVFFFDNSSRRPCF